jgi:ribosomal protein L15E
MFTEDVLLQMVRDRQASYERQAEMYRLARLIRRDRALISQSERASGFRRRVGRGRRRRPVACLA